MPKKLKTRRFGLRRRRRRRLRRRRRDDARSPNSLGSARALEIARPGCSKTQQVPTFVTSGTLGSSTALLKLTQTKRYEKKLFDNAMLGSRLALATWLCSSKLLPWVCSGPPYMRIYVYNVHLFSCDFFWSSGCLVLIQMTTHKKQCFEVESTIPKLKQTGCKARGQIRKRN